MSERRALASGDVLARRYELQDLFAREYRGIDAHGAVLSELVPTGHLPTFLPALKSRGLELPRAVYEAAQSQPRPS